jgi:aspartyl-tRNA(Asn)/glutamyl-tRNA(Gln) amidotransferase subunit A
MEEVSIPHLRVAIQIYYIVATSEASANLARFDGVRYGRRAVGSRDLGELYFESRSQGFGAEVKRRILLGTFALSSGYYDAYYGRARAAVEEMRGQFHRAFEKVDLLVTPTAPSGAFALGEKVGDPLSMYLSDIYTTPASLAGLPAVAVPSGRDAAGLPLSVQLLAPPFAEGRLLRGARALEKATGWQESPPLGRTGGA